MIRLFGRTFVMATSSFTARFVCTDPEAIDTFIDALENIDNQSFEPRAISHKGNKAETIRRIIERYNRSTQEDCI